jgi:hypothetical protein
MYPCVCTHGCIDTHTYVRICVRMYVRTYVRMCACMYVDGALNHSSPIDRVYWLLLAPVAAIAIAMEP